MSALMDEQELSRNGSGAPHAEPVSSASGLGALAAVEVSPLLPGMTTQGMEECWRAVYPIPLRLEVSIPVASFRVRDLLALDPEQILMTGWASGRDLPLGIGDVQLCWVEFEVVEQAMAVRITGVL